MHHPFFLLSISTLLLSCAALPATPSTPLTFGLSQSHISHSLLLNNASDINLNATNPPLTAWPVRLPFRYRLPGHDSSYFTISSYTIPQPQPSSDLVLSTIITMVQKLDRDGEPGDTFASIRLRAAAPVGVTWEFEHERPFAIDRRTALVVLNAVANLEIEYGVASLWKVLFQQDGFVYGSFNLTIATDSQASNSVSINTS
ncbi:hypothetical protein ABVK25_009886 [Lepraria finkii]|uniref:Uncharacterized protein n=1 Tax=Lepraria finkii TaxID=1340010 RepID=A0ABR4AYB5_9LECA